MRVEATARAEPQKKQGGPGYVHTGILPGLILAIDARFDAAPTNPSAAARRLQYRRLDVTAVSTASPTLPGDPPSITGGDPADTTDLDATLDVPAPDGPAPEYARGTVLGRYVVLDRLGAGGMGVVYAAWDPELDRRVAIKLLHARLGRAPGDASPLLREARAMARLTHPNVLAVYDVGTLDGQTFITTELVDGVTLRQWLQAPRPRRDVLAVLVAAGAGLAAAHAAGIVHRDFKPENVMVAHDGRVRVMDFGLARPLAALSPAAAAASGLYRTAALAGTPAYMAPEQWEGRRQDAQADIFAFCVVAWEALTGEHPFAGPTLVATAEAIVGGRVRPPPPGVRLPYWLLRTLLVGLRVAPASRHRDMPALLAALQADPGVKLVRGAQISLLAAAAVALVYAGWLVTRPGSVSVRVLGERGPVTPSAVQVGPHALAITGDTAVGEVPVGTYRLTVAAPDHVPREAVVEVERGREVGLDLALEHERGRFDLEVDPAGATVFVDDDDHGGRLHGLSVTTGSHRIRVRHPGRYDRDMTWTVAAGQTRAGYASLPPALVWSLRETGAQHDDIPLDDLDGDGRRELLHRNFARIAVFDPHRGRELWRAPNDPMHDAAHWVADFDGDGQRDVAVAEDRGRDGWSLALWSAADLERPDAAPRWTRAGERGPPPAAQDRGVTVDADGDGAHDLVTALPTPGTVTAYAGASGRALWQVPVGAPPDAILLAAGVPAVVVVTAGRRLALDPRTGAPLWAVAVDATPVDSARLTPRADATRHDLLVATRPSGASLALELRDGADGSLRWTHAHPHDFARWRPQITTVPGAVLVSLGPDTYHHDTGTGALVWRRPFASNIAALRHAEGEPWFLTTTSPRGLVAHTLAAGEPLFERELGGPSPAPAVLYDWDADGRRELTAMGSDRALHMFDRDGRHEAAVYLPDASPEHLAEVGDLDLDGAPDLALRGLGGPALVRGAKVLWSRRGQDAVRAAPIVADLDRDGRHELVVAGVFGSRGIHILDAATGALHHPGRRDEADIIRAPVLVPRPDGGLDILAHVLDPTTSLVRYDSRTGGRSRTGRAHAPGYASPALADLDLDGRDELLLTPWEPGPFAVLDPDTLDLVWSFPLPAGGWTAPTVARTADGAHLGFHLLDGTLLVVDAATRSERWRLPFGRTPFVAPTVVDLDGDGAPELVASFVAEPGDLVCLRLADGAELWRRPGLAGRSAPVVALDLDGDTRPELLHVSDGAGVLALDGAGATRWQWKPRPRLALQPRSDGGGLVTDLDGDGAPELVTALRDGVVYVLDARSGALRWMFPTGEARVEAPPVAADIDGDGRQELFIGAHDHTLHALRSPAAP